MDFKNSFQLFSLLKNNVNLEKIRDIPTKVQYVFDHLISYDQLYGLIEKEIQSDQNKLGKDDDKAESYLQIANSLYKYKGAKCMEYYQQVNYILLC